MIGGGDIFATLWVVFWAKIFLQNKENAIFLFQTQQNPTQYLVENVCPENCSNLFILQYFFTKISEFTKKHIS